MDEAFDHVRTGAYRRYAPGTVFVEKGVPSVVVGCVDCPDGTFECRLRRLTPDEAVVWDVHRS